MWSPTRPPLCEPASLMANPVSLMTARAGLRRSAMAASLPLPPRRPARPAPLPGSRMPSATWNPAPPQRACRADGVLVGHVVADEHRRAAGERRARHQRLHRLALVHAARPHLPQHVRLAAARTSRTQPAAQPRRRATPGRPPARRGNAGRSRAPCAPAARRDAPRPGAPPPPASSAGGAGRGGRCSASPGAWRTAPPCSPATA